MPFVISCRNGISALPMGKMAQTPANAEGRRLYVAHCAACHGPTGEGDGPAASALRIRPRAFPLEPFRYVSTLDATPTTEDLVQTIRSGRRFGDMPAFPQLTDRQIQVLVNYVRDFSRRGWSARIKEQLTEHEELTPEEIEEIARERVAPGQPIRISWPAPGFRPDTELGHELYVAACAACHGTTGRGDGLAMPKDERGKPITVSDLTSGEFRGGTGVIELFKRIRCGVPGTPMPAQPSLSDEQIWQLVYYIRFLAGEQG